MQPRESNMARIRTIKPTFWEDELVGAMPATTRLTFVGLFSLADDEGRMPSSPTFVRNKVFTYDETTSTPDVEAALLQLHEAGRIRLYGAAPQRYLEVVNFRRHQYIQKPQPSQLPPPGGRYPLVRMERASEQVVPVLESDQSDAVPVGKGREGKVSVSGLRPSTSSAGGSTAVAVVAKPKRSKPSAPSDQVVRCFDWYCQLWGKQGAFSLELTAKRARAIDKALKAHGSDKVAAVIRGHHSNDWRHGHLNRNDITVLLRDDNIDVGVELAAKAAGIQPVGAASVGDELERMGY